MTCRKMKSHRTCDQRSPFQILDFSGDDLLYDRYLVPAGGRTEKKSGKAEAFPGELCGPTNGEENVWWLCSNEAAGV
jgi:hypothetical protein